MSALYVFALTNQSAPPLQHLGHRIEFVGVSGIYAAVERVEAPPVLSEAALRAQHDIVLKIAAAVDATLPARFGAVVDRQELEQLVSMRQATIGKALELVAGRVQMTVRAFTADAPAARSETTAVEHHASGTAYLEQRRAATTALPAGPSRAMADALRPFVVSERLERGQGRVEWTMYHLVDRGAIPEYKRAAAEFESSAIAVTGPWPPFAFAPDLWA